MRTIIHCLTLFITLSTINYANPFDESDYPSRCAPAKTVYYGTIQFPLNLRHVPDIRLYYKGSRIRCENNNDTKKACFSIADENHQTCFKLLFTEHLQFETEQNVVKYLKVPEDVPYKFYALSLMKNDPFLEEAEESAANANKTKWHIRELRRALHNGIIPDDTIIVCLDPAYVEKVDGGSTTTIPAIKIRSDIIAFVGSEDKIHQKADELLLSLVMDCDAIHAAMQQEIHPKYERKMIVALTT